MTIVDDQPDDSCAGHHQACQIPARRGKWVVWGALVNLRRRVQAKQRNQSEILEMPK